MKAKKPQNVFGNSTSNSDEHSKATIDRHPQEKLNPEQMEVIQKSMVRSLSRCGKKNKTILLEASVSNLNPKNMKRRFSYRPNRKNDTDGKSSIDEQDFPWYQKAWIEEMELRVSCCHSVFIPFFINTIYDHLIIMKFILF